MHVCLLSYNLVCVCLPFSETQIHSFSSLLDSMIFMVLQVCTMPQVNGWMCSWIMLALGKRHGLATEVSVGLSAVQ